VGNIGQGVTLSATSLEKKSALAQSGDDTITCLGEYNIPFPERASFAYVENAYTHSIAIVYFDSLCGYAASLLRLPYVQKAHNRVASLNATLLETDQVKRFRSCHATIVAGTTPEP
jgi:hypothetical protein